MRHLDPDVTACSHRRGLYLRSAPFKELTALRCPPGQVVLKAVPSVPIYYTTNNVSALENTAYLADAASIYDAAKGIAIPAG